ncbi:MAG TPA: copper transporter [Acidimicrobiales bacterium]|nr:copper transporter [Acidimicrobiales bacterium]
MVSFRFHLVSLTAVFLALAIGIAMGATVVDRATVSLLESRLDTVKRHSDETNQQNDQLRAEVNRWNQFAGQTGDQLLAGRLSGVSVVVVVVEGSDKGSLDAMRQSLVAANATLQGTLWLNAKLALRDNDDVTALRTLTDAPTARPADLRRLVASQVAAALTSTTALAPLGALVDKGYARAEAPGGATVGPANLTTAAARFVVVADGKAAAPNNELAQPLVDELARLAPSRVVGAEAGRDAKPGSPAVRAQFVGLLRGEPDLKASTVDDLDIYVGRVAVVLALRQMSDGRLGHYGVGTGATRLIPDIP